MVDSCTSSSIRRWAIGMVVAYAVLVVPAILAGGGGTSQASDMMEYHTIEIRRLESQWPAPDLRDSFTSTTPGLHVVVAVLAKAGLSPSALRLVTSLAGLAAWFVAWRVARAWTDPGRAALLVAPVALSPYLLGASVWITTDAAGLALGAATLGIAVVGGRGTRQRSAWGGLSGTGAVLTRQILLWTILPGLLRAWFMGRSARERVLSLLLLAAPPVTCVGCFIAIWGGSMPPRFQPFHRATWNPSAITLTLALFGAFGFVLLPPLLRKIDAPARRAAVLAALLGVAISAAPRSDYRKVLPPEAQRVGTRSGDVPSDVAAGVVQGAGEVGRWGGPLWDAARITPVVHGRSVLLVLLGGLGGAVLMTLWGAADRAGRGPPAFWLIAAIATMVAAQSLNAQTFQRYFDPWILLVLGWLVGMGDLGRRDRGVAIGIGALAALQLVWSVGAVLRPAFLGPSLGAW